AVADRFGVARRGRLVPGAFADLVVWREEEFAAKATYESPHQFSGGVRTVMVNGETPYADGAFTGRRPGRFLER
ncbi:MAG: D-aminoacylase, partial [Kiritimatiellae bacterium]|nr:D-aminoacylase [Kiritimatiellia bacterium]